jgi:hypothetical protein
MRHIAAYGTESRIGSTGRSRRGLLAGTVVMLALLAAPTATLAGGALDQQQLMFGSARGLIGTRDDIFTPAIRDVRHAQTFVAGVSGTLDQIDLAVRVVGDPGVALSVAIQSVDGGGAPSETTLGSGSIAQASVPACNTSGCMDLPPTGDYTSFTFVSVPLSSTATVSAGTTYAIVLSATGAALDIDGDFHPDTRYEWAGTTDEAAYASGQSFSTIGNGWGASGVDFAFKTYISSYSAAIQAPINADGSSTFKSKGVVPVRFSLSLNGAPTCSLPPATIAVVRTGGSDPGPVNEDTYLQGPDNGSNFRIAGCQYTYNLNAKALGPGTYSVAILIAGATVGGASFEIH